MFSIKARDLELKLEAVPVESLLKHEETFPEATQKLVLEFKNLAHQQNPIIIDERNIVLDGNHRVSAFRKLNFKYILVCKIDYFHENTNLKYWYRLVGDLENINTLRQIVEGMRGTFHRVEGKKALKSRLENNPLHCGVQKGNFFATIRFDENVVEDAVGAYRALEKIQGALAKKNKRLKYIPCQYVQESQFCESLRKDEVVIWTPQITKEMVVDAVEREKVFAPKTTRHVIGARPLMVNVPTVWFQENISPEEINKKFMRFIEQKGIQRFGPGQVIDGRYYAEELFVFYNKKQ